jgi:hypothetical protein
VQHAWPKARLRQAILNRARKFGTSRGESHVHILFLL